MDIESREDLYKIVSLFYQKLFADDLMRHFFVSLSEPNDLEIHLKLLVDFWDGVLFHSGTYSKNAMRPHIEKHIETPFEKKHFDSWLELFKSSIDELFIGENCEIIKNRAESIAMVMRLKILHS